MARPPLPAALCAAGATGFIVAAQIFRLPHALKDAATSGFLPDYSLHFPWGHLATTPFSALADAITYNSARQDQVLVAYLLLLYWPARWAALRGRRGALRLLREAGAYLLYLGVVASYLTWAILSHRPAASLVLPSDDLVAVDFHSHTSFSHDGRKAFSPQANMAWHRDAGFSAAFITDHNAVDGARLAHGISKDGYRSLLGEEVSLQDAHVGVLGNRGLIDNRIYDGSVQGVRRFLAECEKTTGGLPVLNLPEYWLHHWDRLEEMAAWGAAGIEIVNATPKGLDFPPQYRARVVELARRRKLFLAGATDNHGWGRACCVWNVLRLPGQARMEPDALQRAILDKLKKDAFSAVLVVERVKHDPAPGPGILLDPLATLWVSARLFTAAQALISVCWLWLGVLAASFF